MNIRVFLQPTPIKSNNYNTMNSMNKIEIEQYKDQIPEFIIKLYHILKKQEYQDYISWAAEGTEVLIKSPKKVEEKVLPHYFRHKRLSSFIRQMNMYNFTKVNKVTKEKNYMYFKNDLFTSENILDMKKISRKNGKKCEDATADASIKKGVAEKREENLKRDKINLKENIAAFEKIRRILELLVHEKPETEMDLSPAIQICESMAHQYIFEDIQERQCEVDSGLSQLLHDQTKEDKKSNGHDKDLIEVSMNMPIFQSFAIPSLCSLSHFE